MSDEKPVAWAVVGYFKNSGGWCVQFPHIFSDEASALHCLYREYQNDPDFSVKPLYRTPAARPGWRLVPAKEFDALHAAARNLCEHGLADKERYINPLRHAGIEFDKAMLAAAPENEREGGG